MVARFVFVLLGLLSVWLTYTGIRIRFGLPWAERRRMDLPFDRIGSRIWRFVTEVLLQSRVIWNRPVVGILHALVMWGFIAFAGVSLRHLWMGVAGFGHPPDGGIYRTFVAIWAGLVTLSILGLAYRRFVLRPTPLGALSPTSAIVTTLIVTLMGTYLADWADIMSVHSTAWYAIWWLHTLALLAFPPIIVRSKHLHLVLAPVTIFFRPETTSRMRPFELDIDGMPTELGLAEFKELSVKDVLDVNACVECGRCTSVCPANRSGSLLDPKQLILQLQHGLTANSTTIAGTTDEVATGTAWIREGDLMDCTTCGACEEACPVGIEHVRKIVGLRHGLVNNERITLQRVTQQLKPLGNPPFSPLKFAEPRTKLIAEEQFPIFTEGMNILLWLGCGVSYNSPDVARSMKAILDALGKRWGVLESEICCGETKHQIGMADVEIAPQLVETFTELGVKFIVVCDPHCTGMLAIDHRLQNPQFAQLGITVVHHAQFISEMLPALALTPQAARITLHDPCKLGRGLDITAQPRSVLNACGAQIVEPSEHGRRSTCCGAGGGQSFILDEKRPKELRMNYQRFDQLMATKPDVIATACPHCPVMLKEAADVRGVAIPIQDIATIVASRLTTHKKEVRS